MGTVTMGTGARRRCLITGASAGIGAAIAEEYAAQGWDLVLTARREAPMNSLAEKLRAKHDTQSTVLVVDLAEPDATETLMAAISGAGIQVDGLVNNAGYGLGGDYLDHAWAEHADFLQVMLRAPAELAHAVSPGMVDRGFGRILNVASVAGYIPGTAGSTMYPAVKSFLIKFSQSLHAELEPHGVHVSALCPGFTHSEFHDVSGSREEVSQLPGFLWKNAAEVAAAGVDGCERNMTIVLPGLVNQSLAGISKALPDRITRFLLSHRPGLTKPTLSTSTPEDA